MKRPALIRGRPSAASLRAASIGAAMLGVSAALFPAGWPVITLGAAALLAALPGRLPAAGTLAALAATLASGIGISVGSVPLPAAAVVGVLVLAYVLALDCAETRPAGGTLRCAGTRVPVAAAGLAVASLTAVAAAAALSPSLWLTMAGPAAAGAVLLVAAI